MDLEGRKNEQGLLLNLEVHARWLEEWLYSTVCDLVRFNSLCGVFFFFFFTIIHMISFLDYGKYSMSCICSVCIYSMHVF